MHCIRRSKRHRFQNVNKFVCSSIICNFFLLRSSEKPSASYRPSGSGDEGGGGGTTLAPHTQGIKTPNEFYNGAVFHRKGFSDETMYSHRNTHLMLPVFDVWTGAEGNFEMVKVGVMWYLRKDSWKRVPPFVFASLCPRWKWLGAKFCTT